MTTQSVTDPAPVDETRSGYQKEVLAVRCPVAVVLASRPVPLSTIIDLVPGAMIQFEKNCEEPLVLEVGGHPLATGEAVKVEDKFGLRVRGFDVPTDD